MRRLDAQLVANWVDVFGPVVTFAHRRSQWPERTAVDSVEFRVGGMVPGRFHVMVCVGYEEPFFNEPRIWVMRPFARKNQDSWEEFINLLGGTPRRIVADMDGAISGAATACFPLPGACDPTFHWSDLHVRRARENALAPLHHEPDHNIWKPLERALFAPCDWDQFAHVVEHENRTATPMPAATR